MLKKCLWMSTGAILLLTGCAFRGIPSHGGGKRFYPEQEIIARASRGVVDEIPWRNLQGKKATLWLYSLGDAGGGVSKGGGFDWGGAVGSFLGRSEQRGQTSVGSRSSVEGIIIEGLVKNGIRFVDDPDEAEIDIYAMVDSFGTNRWRFDVVIYATENLSAQVKMHAFAVDRKLGTYTDIGKAAKRVTYFENFVFNIGPLNRGEFKVDSPTPEF
jgi:hypothetical protein